MKLIASLSRFWCQAMHPNPMWPVNGQYRCPACLRVYPVAWEQSAAPRKPAADREITSVAYARARTGLQAAPVAVTAD